LKIIVKFSVFVVFELCSVLFLSFARLFGFQVFLLF
jgi:hypothetical protein